MKQEEVVIGQVIRTLRKDKKYSQEALAEGICSRRYLIEVEKGTYTPTLFIVERLSERLRVDIMKYYQLVQQHRGIETHQHVQQLINLMNPYALDELLAYATKCEQLTNFDSGEPRQYILYSKALYESNMNKNYGRAIELAIEGMRVQHPEFDPQKPLQNVYSYIELKLIHCIATNYVRNKSVCGRDLYKSIILYLYPYTQDSTYNIHHNAHDKIILFVAAVCNIAEISIRENLEDNAIEGLRYVIALLTRLSYSNFLVPVLVNYAILCYRENSIEDAKKYYEQAKVFCLYSDTVNETPESLEQVRALYMPLLEG